MYQYLILSLFTMTGVFVVQHFNLFGFESSNNHDIIAEIIGYSIGFLIMFILSLKFNIFFGLKRIKLVDEERLIKEQGSSHLTKWQNYPGKLFLTPTKLIFKSQFKLEKFNTIIPIYEIKKVKIYRLFGFITIGLKIITNNRTETFLLSRPKRWIQTLQTNLPQSA